MGDEHRGPDAVGLLEADVRKRGMQLRLGVKVPKQVVFGELPKTSTGKIGVSATLPAGLAVAQTPSADTSVGVTLSAVDQGILNITQFATPDPHGYFFGKQRYAPDLLDIYGRLIEKMDGTLLEAASDLNNALKIDPTYFVAYLVRASLEYKLKNLCQQ